MVYIVSCRKIVVRQIIFAHTSLINFVYVAFVTGDQLSQFSIAMYACANRRFRMNKICITMAPACLDERQQDAETMFMNALLRKQIHVPMVGHAYTITAALWVDVVCYVWTKRFLWLVTVQDHIVIINWSGLHFLTMHVSCNNFSQILKWLI